jgi:hypothetical protein
VQPLTFEKDPQMAQMNVPHGKNVKPYLKARYRGPWKLVV